MTERIKEHARVLLERSEHLLRTDVRYLASGGFWLISSQIVSMAGGFALSLAFGNLVSKEVFGNYKFVFSVIGLFGTFALTASGAALAQAVARGFDGALKQAFRLDLLWTLPSAAFMLGGAVYYSVNGNAILALSLIVAAILSPLLSAFNMYISYLQGKRDFRRVTLFGFVTDILTPAVLILIMLSGASGYVPAYIAAYYVVMTACSALFYYRTIKIYRPAGEMSPQLQANATHLSFINVLGRAVSYIDKILVFHYLGAAPLAIYTFASAPSQYVLRFNGIFKTLALPKLAARDIPTLKKTLPRKIAIHFFLSFVATVGFIVLVPYFFQWLFPQYDESIPYAQALGLTILSAPGVWLGQTLIAHMRKRELYLMNTVIPLLRVGLYVALIPLWGIWGVVATTLLTGFFGFLLSAWVFSRL